ncbi:glycosyltransferase family 1 protein [Anaerobacillus alkalilacustris]|uniref:Glycosyltransferase family 1 protein n=1 Tax=Anaerobacillus alkalilacustris TaxID=393763 RepID=A0A1S2LGQ6_9BACI|nr:glycosyltransferase family 4 protein [Anaerobacillus alkalilacustris]OIJ11263.1 glycosyltransferase family 1 protein [Anaerobacillus alkalilacustris]
MARVLVTAHLGRHFRIFGQYDYKVLLSLGHEVHIAANFNDSVDQFEDSNVIKHQVDFSRNPFSFVNLNAIKQLKKILDDHNFDLVHTQSPSGGAITRVAARGARKNGTKVLYTAHGFHFFQGAPMKNRLIFYNIEKFLGYMTDTIITINDEDYKAAKGKLPVKDVRHIHGVGIDLDKFKPQTSEEKILLRNQYGYSSEDFLIICAGELSYRKNQTLLINSIFKLKEKIPYIKLLLVGSGDFLNQYQQQVENLGIKDNVDFLGYRKDVVNLMRMSDIAVSASRQEGLPVNVMEAMATGLPLVVTNCRGNRDLVKTGENGFVVEIDDVEGFSNSIYNLYSNKETREKFKMKNLEKINIYALDAITEEMKKIYSDNLSF